MNYPELHEANGKRTATAAARTASQACKAMDAIDCHEPTSDRDRGSAFRYHEALKARHDNPDASLAEIAASLGMTKDTYSARLRRAFLYAAKLQAAQQHGDAA